MNVFTNPEEDKHPGEDNQPEEGIRPEGDSHPEEGNHRRRVPKDLIRYQLAQANSIHTL